MGRFEEIQVGDRAEIKHVITAEDVAKFVDLSGDDNRIHLDEDYASHTYLKKPVVHGMIGASFISTIIGTRLPGDGALWFSQNLEFERPVRVGDEIRVQAKVIKKHRRESILELETVITNQHNQVCTSGLAKVKVVEREVSEPLQESDAGEKTVLVVGGTGGIGAECCLTLARAGYDLIVNFRSNEERAREIARQVEKLGRSCITCLADVSREEDVRKLASSVKRSPSRLTGVVFAATPSLFNQSVFELSYQQFQEQLDVSLKGLFHITQHVLPQFFADKYGKVVVLSTQYVDRPVSQLSHYVAAKSALTSFGKALAVELAPKGVRVNLVSPGMTETDLIADVPLKARLLTEANTPLKRLATVQDVAHAVHYLISPLSDFLTGETIRVNGGQVML